MVQRCCVPLCSSKAGDSDIYGIKIRFHRMPHTVDRFMRWCLQISDNRRLKPVLTSGSRVCSRHFRKEDYLMKKPFGNNPLKVSAEPCIFKWNSACFEGTGEAVPSGEELEEECVGGATLVYDVDLKIHREIQCCILDKKIVEDEVSRKNSVIEQLLGRISLLEEEQKEMHGKIGELRAANTYFERQIRELHLQNQVLEQKVHTRARAKLQGEWASKGTQVESESSPDLEEHVFREPLCKKRRAMHGLESQSGKR